MIKALEETYPRGFEIGDFVITFEYLMAPEPDRTPEPWDSERFTYAGWDRDGMTLGSAAHYYVDEWLLTDALKYIRSKIEAVSSPAANEEKKKKKKKKKKNSQTRTMEDKGTG